MNIQRLKRRCEIQQEMIQSWKKAYERQGILLRRVLVSVKFDEDLELLNDIIREISTDFIVSG